MPDAGDAATQLANAYDSRLNKVAPNAIWIQLGLMTALGSAALILFSILRPNNSVIYQPKTKYSEDGHRPPKIEKGWLSWIKPIVTTREAALLETVGLDAVCYLRFLRMCRSMFAVVAAICCLTLFPVDIIYNLKNNVGSRTYITMMTIQDVHGAWLWAHVAMAYIVTFIVFFFIWINYSAMVKLRWQWFRSPEYQNSLHARSLMITQVSKAQKSDQGIASLLTSLQVPYPTTAVHIGRRVGELPELIEAHNDTVRALEGVLAKYFKNPNKLPTQRPTMKIGGAMGCGGKKVDAIEHLTNKIKRFDERIETARQAIDLKKPENYGFASFESVPYAHIVAKRLQGKRKNGARFELAPVPQDIIWTNLHLYDSQKRGNKFMGFVLLLVLLFFYTIPLLGVSVLANITALSGFVHFIDVWTTKYSFLMSAFVGIVPPLCSVLLQLLLPAIIRWIAKGQGSATHSQSDRMLTARYSAFLIFTQFFLFSVIGVLVGVISKVVTTIQDTSGATTGKKIWETIQTIPGLFQSTWVLQSSYWLTVMPLRGASALFDLAQIISLLLVPLRTRLFGRTVREIREWTKPPEFDYAVFFSSHLLVVAVGLVYSPLAPLVPLFAALAFSVSSVVYKYQLMYVCVSRVETGGRLWRVVVNRVLFALIMMQALMLLTIGLQTGWYHAIALAPPMVMVIIYKIILKNKFDDRFTWFIPTEAEMGDVVLHHADARKHRLQKRFGHPSLNDALFTPMLHKDIQHLLPTIYNGRVGQAQGDMSGKAVEQNTAGGLTFNILQEHDLQYDRGEYLRQRDEDAMTITTAAGYAGTPLKGPADGDYFNARRAEYLKHGAGVGSGSQIGLDTPGDVSYELSRMQTGASQENLIQYQSPYGQAARGMTHSPSTSMASFDAPNYYGTGGEPIEMVQQPLRSHHYPPAMRDSPPRSRGPSPGPGGMGMGMGTPPMGRPDSRGSMNAQQQQQQPYYGGGGPQQQPYQRHSPQQSRGHSPQQSQGEFRPPSAGDQYPRAGFGGARRMSADALGGFDGPVVGAAGLGGGRGQDGPGRGGEDPQRRGYALDDRPAYSRVETSRDNP